MNKKKKEKLQKIDGEKKSHKKLYGFTQARKCKKDLLAYNVTIHKNNWMTAPIFM